MTTGRRLTTPTGASPAIRRPGAGGVPVGHFTGGRPSFGPPAAVDSLWTREGS